MTAKAMTRATIRGSSKRLLMSPELLAWEVVDAAGGAEVAARKQVVKSVYIWRERSTDRRSGLLKLVDRRLGMMSVTDREG